MGPPGTQRDEATAAELECWLERKGGSMFHSYGGQLAALDVAALTTSGRLAVDGGEWSSECDRWSTE